MSMVTGDDKYLNWTKLGQRMAQQRATMGGLSQEEAAKRAQVGVTTWRDLENAKKTAVRVLTLTAISVSLDWGADGALNILLGGEPSSRDLHDDIVAAGLVDLEAEMAEVRTRLSSIEQALVRIAGDEAAPEPKTPTSPPSPEAVAPHPRGEEA